MIDSRQQAINVLAYVHLRNIHNSTGAGRVARQLTEHLAAREGLNVHILADQEDHRKIVGQVGWPWTSFQYHLFAKDTSKQQAQWLMLRSPKAEAFWPTTDIVHCTGESFVPTSRSRLLVTVHDAACFESGAHPNTFAQKTQRVKWQILYKALSRKADLFHTVSQFSAERIGSFFPDIRPRLRVVYNAVARRFFEPVNTIGKSLLERLQLDNQPYILVPGGLHYRKNADLILSAWPLIRERIPDIRLVVSGHCDSQLANRTKALHVPPILTNFVNDDELCALYHYSQAVWFPSRYEGFGLPVVEAMASGAPVVASNSTSLPEVAGGAAVLVDPDSVEQNVEAVAGLVNDARLCKTLRERGRRRAEQFTWQAAAAEMHKLYTTLM